MAHDSCHHGSPVAPGQDLAPVRPEQTVGDVAHHHAGALAVMEQMGINHCCGAHLTLSEAAAAAGVPVDALLAALNARRQAPVGAPQGRSVHLDVREDIRQGREPFARIMAAVTALGAEQALVLRVSFEPVPLYDVLGKRGFARWTERRAADDWSVTFYRDGAPPASPAAVAAPATTAARRAVLDVRGLEPPQPMLRVLEEADRLGPADELEVRHDRRPMFLYPQLDDRGFVHDTDEPEPGLVRILIRRGGT